MPRPQHFLAALIVLLLPAFAYAQMPGSPFTFAWGSTLKVISASTTGEKTEEPGPMLRVRRGGLEILYYFYQGRRIQSVEIETVTENGKSVPRYGRTVFEPESPAADARLYSVSISFPALPFSGDLPVELTSVYGKPGNLTGATADLENLSTRVRVYLETFKGRRYLRRFVFTSREEGGRIQAAEKKLKEDEARTIKDKLEAAGKKDPGRPKPGPTGLRSELLREQTEETGLRTR